MPGQEDLAAYLCAHALELHLEAMLNAMLLERPEDVPVWCAAYLSRKHATQPHA